MQTQNTWNNDFLTLDLSQTWQTGGPPLKGLPQPDGPPEVALGYLWNSYDSLFLYGGQFSWKPPVAPTPFATWEYQISAGNWVEYSDPLTAAGESAPSGGVPVQRSSEGAGANVPSLGRGFYFGGHEDGYTTPGWSQSIARIYLQSLLEYTFPGYTNPDVTSIKSAPAGSGGVYRNITQGGLQSAAGFTQRAEGLLIYIVRILIGNMAAENVLSALRYLRLHSDMLTTLFSLDLVPRAFYWLSLVEPIPHL